MEFKSLWIQGGKAKAKVLICAFILLMAVSQVSGKYDILDNPASKNQFHSDRQTGPVVGPHPQQITNGNEELKFHECAVEIEYSSETQSHSLFNIMEIYLDVAFGKGHIQRCPEGLRQTEMGKYLSNGKKIVKLKILFNGAGSLPAGFDAKYESYNLTVNSGAIYVDAPYYPGVIRALDSLSQLIERDETENSIFKIKYVPVIISDKPAFPYRGLMLDTSREFFYPDTIKQLIDGMMLARMNVFHWHFVDSDSMPMYLESYPDLTNYTAFSKKEIYTPDDVKDIVKYAQVRGIKVVPEFEGPGHMNSLGQYPAFQKSIGCYRDSKVYNQASGGPPDSVIDPVNNSTYQFLYNFMKDLNKTFESDYWHLGGDEVEAKCFSDIAGVNEFLTKNKMGVNQLQQYYTTKERDIFTEINPSRIAGYWYQSEKLSYHPNDILQYWGPSNKIRDEMAYHADNYFVISSSDHYYLDCGYSNQFGDRSWCGPIKSWKEFWSIDPSMYSSAGKLLGAEACAWSEMNNEFELFTKVFPRSGAMSFRYWNPKAPTQEGALHEMMMRLQYRLKAYGVPTEKISMRYCEEHTHHCFGI